MTQGVFLPCFKKRGYMFSAFNLAYSIKHFNPEIKICLFHDEVIGEILPENLYVFDQLIQIPVDVKFKEGRIDPAWIKACVYDYLPYDENFIMDVDAVCFQDIQPLFDSLSKHKDYYSAPMYGSHQLSDGDHMEVNGWANANQVWEKYKLHPDAILPSINSSFQYVRKSPEAKALFDQLKENLNDPIPLNELKDHWGGTQPDELYMDIALAQKNICPPTGTNYIFFGKRHDPTKSISDLESQFYFMSIYGGNGFTSPFYTEHYDRFLHRIMRGKRTHNYKYDHIARDKHANGKPQATRNVIKEDTILAPGLIPVNKTRLIDDNRLIRIYPGPDGRNLKVSNWLNGSFHAYKGQVYFAYRMEMRPFCKTMKLGLCLLDNELQPNYHTNVLLNLHSNLRGHAKNFHVEDPRLFTYKDELYLSYTDGYQMGQAKIDPQTLQATESFYIDLPRVGRTEKNWTFFEHDGNLYSVYDIASHTIFKMNGPHYEKVYSTPFEHSWQWGELRGGTSPMLIGDRYLSFFHSASPITHKNAQGRCYYMGAYTFEAKPPFRVLSISKEPIMSGELCDDSIPRLSNKIFVVFPCGVLKLQDSYLVSYGWNDFQVRYCEVTNELLKENLIEVNQLQEA